MLRQLRVGTVINICNIAIHALVVAIVVQITSRIVVREGYSAAFGAIDHLMIATRIMFGWSTAVIFEVWRRTAGRGD